MFFHTSDTRQPLSPGDVVCLSSGKQYVIDRYIASGGFSLMYIAHQEGSSKYVALKELFPRSLDDMAAQRQADGTISIFNPISETSGQNHPEIWKELATYFRNEVRLTNKAARFYDPKGNQIRQNSPDVLHAEGPFEDARGNHYLTIDTYEGEPLRQLIESGFVRNEDQSVSFNQYMEEILSVLAETALHLAHLHGDSKMYHLDLSPDNIYVVKTLGGTHLTPHIIDYGSAFDLENPTEETYHRYTMNPHSAPEVAALAELQEPDCGYRVDASSDTYAIASILFYAATGQVFTSELRMFSSGWKQRIINAYGPGFPGSPEIASFASALISFLEQGLASAQSFRFRTAKSLYDALCKLKKQYQSYGNPLSRMDPDELMSNLVLEKHPLYDYRSSDGDIHVLCLGSGAFVRRMILSLLSCGQMIDSKLNIRIVSGSPERELKEFLLAKAPLLGSYSNLVSEDTVHQYVRLEYQYQPNLLEEGVCEQVAAENPDAHYIIVSLGGNNANATAARLYANALTRQAEAGHPKTIINYYRSEDGAENTRSDAALNPLPCWLQVDAFGNTLSSYGKTIRELARRTVKLSYVYEKAYNPSVSITDCAQKLAGDLYDQRSSCASALHLKYKLASVGINPAPTTNKRVILSAYQKALAGGGLGKLLELEHRRWMMYMIADGYIVPTTEELRRYGFEFYNNVFHPKWRSDLLRLHPCLVPCGDGGLKLDQAVWNRFFDGKDDAAEIEAAIQASELDELDQVSLRLHLLAREKCEAILQAGILDNLFQRIQGKLQRERERIEAQRESASPEALSALEWLEKKRSMVRGKIRAEASALLFTGDGGKLKELEEAFGMQGINISEEIQQLSRYLLVFAEFASNKDYKANDATIINNLLWILYAENVTLIKLRGRTIADNITGPMVLQPQKLIYFGMERRPEWEEFFRNHGQRGIVRFVPCPGNTVAEITPALERLVAESQGDCLIDVTGAEETMVIAGQRVADEHKIGIVWSTQDGGMENIARFPLAPVYTLKPVLSAAEIYALHGASEIPSKERYMLELSDTVAELWDFYQEFQSDWEMITAFFASRGQGVSELFLRNVSIFPSTQWRTYTHWVEKYKWDTLGLSSVFQKMVDAGFLRGFEKHTVNPSRLRVSFEYPEISSYNTSDLVASRFNQFFNYKLNAVFQPFRCRITRDEGMGMTIDVSSGCQVEIFGNENTFYDSRNPGNGPAKQYFYTDLIPALRRLEQIGMIVNLKAGEDCKNPSGILKFTYLNTAVKDCLCKSGNILEFYVWSEARRTGYFDDCAANFSFAWKEGIRNELDVLLTKGLACLVISCKTSRFNKEHLYEVKYLTERFSLNSKPVIVYSSREAYVDGRPTDDLSTVKNRAKAMGVYLIDLNHLEGSLGEELVRIAKGENVL